MNQCIKYFGEWKRKKKKIYNVRDTKRPNTKYDRANLIFEHYSLRLSHHMAFGYGFRHHDNITNHIYWIYNTRCDCKMNIEHIQNEIRSNEIRKKNMF